MPASAMTAPLPLPMALVLVVVGGTLGAAAREALVLAVPGGGPIPWAILIANLVGAFVLGLVLESLIRHPSASAQKRRLLLGTGFCGGFTTYSTFAVGTLALVGVGSTTPNHSLALALTYALGTVALGAVATWGGIVAGSRRHGSQVSG